MAVAAGVGSKAEPTRSLNPVQSDYVEHCGGCHGIQGISFPARVPRLRDKVGYFLCTPQSRAYLLRLPNVALSSLDDDRLAATMNFIVFQLGGTSANAKSLRFTADEIARERKHSLSGASLVRTRAAVVRQIEQQCSIPVTALQF
ncbi:MAG TPA: cytochrome C [Sphingobium sp.]